MTQQNIEMGKGWAVLGVDIQNDFVSGSLAVPDGAQVIEPTNQITDLAREKNIPIAMSADWHPRRTTHFAEFGGTWPVHCVANTEGSEFDQRLKTTEVEVFHKGMSTKDDGYSPWEGKSTTSGKSLDRFLREKGVHNLVVTGLATDYCVKAGVLDALKKRKLFGLGPRRYHVYLVTDAVEAVNIQPEDGQKALDEMQKAGAIFVASSQIR